MTSEAEPDELPQDPLIGQLVPDPSRIPNLIVLVGFLGRNTREDEEDDGYRRLYLTPALNDYITFKRAAIVHHKPLSPHQSLVGGSVVWLKRDATVQHTRIESRQVQAEFLQGKIMDFARASTPGSSTPTGPSGGSGGGSGCNDPGCSCARSTCCTKVGCPPSVSWC
jgi:hypothetical protein